MLCPSLVGLSGNVCHLFEVRNFPQAKMHEKHSALHTGGSLNVPQKEIQHRLKTSWKETFQRVCVLYYAGPSYE